MTREDMQKSAGIIEDCLAVCKQKNPVEGNFNVNHNISKRCGTADRVISDQSEETIYRRAVCQRGSSSSEDDLIDTSDEFTNTLQGLLIAGQTEQVR